MKKTTMISLFCAIMAVSTAMVVISSEGQDTPHLLGSKACTWGPSYWCQNITTAKGCNAMRHCIPKVWEKMTVPEDRDSVCQICKDMVQQARDQLESNQTQEDLKAVFEGSCALIHIKVIVKECDKFVDEFIPELVETLASQMDPSVVCSVSGLCNSARIDKLLEEHEKQSKSLLTNVESSPDECSDCYSIATHMENKFSQQSRDNVLEQFLNVCGEVGSFSDACSSIVLTNFETIYSHLKDNFKARNICHLSGKCSNRFHVHENDTQTPLVEIRPMSSVGMVKISDDLPCKLCSQLVGHLRDLLVANTTEEEFQLVLEGFCKQMKSFALECKSIVDQYYPEIYKFLTNGLNGNFICQMAGICPAPGKTKSSPVWPLIPEGNARIGIRIMTEDQTPAPLETVNMQLPIERMQSPSFSFSVVDDKYCSTCQFVMNYIKRSVRNLQDRKELENAIREIQITLPGVKGESEETNFLSKYHQAIVELILQQNDISKICGLVAVCATEQQMKLWEAIPESYKQVSEVKDKPNCPLCLLAVQELYNVIKNNKTEASIIAALDKLCEKLPKNLNNQCQDLVKGYSKEIVEKLLEDLSPQEICISLKLCDNKVSSKKPLFDKIVAVPKLDAEGKETCALCEYVLHYIQVIITDPKSEEQVKEALSKVCSKLPKSIQNNCDQFVSTFGDAVVAIIAQEIDPSQVCPMIHLCPSEQLLQSLGQLPKDYLIEKDVQDKPNCPLCLFGMSQLYNMLKDNKTEEAIESALDKLCIHLPKHLIDQCESLVKTYSKEIMEAVVADLTPQEVCVYLQMCDPPNKIQPQPEISFFPLDKDGQIMTNEIPEYPTYIIVDKNVNYNKVEKKPFSEPNQDLEANAVECEVCEVVLRYLEKALSNRKSKDEIEKAIHGVCNQLPRKMNKKCNDFVDQYAEIVIELLAQEISPKEVCTIMELCKNDSTSEIRESVTECALCEAIINFIEEFIEDPYNENDIGKALKVACKHMPGPMQNKCQEIINIYGSFIKDLIKKNGNTRKICSKINACSSNDYGLGILIQTRI